MSKRGPKEKKPGERKERITANFFAKPKDKIKALKIIKKAKDDVKGLG